MLAASMRPFLSLALVLGALACSPAAPAPRTIPTVASAAPAPPPPVDLSEVPAPPGLVVTGRFAKLSASFAVVRGWTKLPMPQSEQVTELLASDAIGPVVDLDQPLDFAVAITGGGLRFKDERAVSAAVKDPDRVKATLSERYKLVPGDNGAVVIQGLGRPQREDGDADEDGTPDAMGDGDRACELAPAFGDAPVRLATGGSEQSAVASRPTWRLVCAWSPKALADLGPWLTRSAPRTPTRADLQVDVRAAPLQAILREHKGVWKLGLGSALSDHVGLESARELLIALGADLVELGTDLAGASVDLTLADAGAQLRVALQLPETTSELARLATGHPERGGLPPAAFWQLPADATVAFFDRGVDEAELTKARGLVLPVLQDLVADHGVTPAEARPLLEGLTKLVSPAPLVYASGVDTPALRKALDAESAARPDDLAAARRVVVQAELGWHVAELDEPSTRLAEALEGFSTALASPSLVAAYRAEHKDGVPPELRAVALPKSMGLPAGTLHDVLELPPPRARVAAIQRAHPGERPTKPAPRPSPMQLHILVVPDGQRTWLAVGGDEALVVARLKTALGSGGDTLASRADLAPLKDRPAGAGGFTTLRAAADPSPLFATSGREALEEALRTAHQGLAPIFFSATALPDVTPATFEARLQVPRDAIEDVVSGILLRGGF